MDTEFEGFIVHSFIQEKPRHPRICLVGRLTNGRVFAVIEDRVQPGFYTRESEAGRAHSAIGESGATLQISPIKTPIKTMDGEPCFWVGFDNQHDSLRAGRIFEGHAVRTYEADLNLADRYLMEHNIHGSLKILGKPQKGRFVDHVFLNPEVKPAAWEPRLSMLSIDIETDAEATCVQAISMAGRDPWNDETTENVLFVGDAPKRDWIRGFSGEKPMLEAFSRLIAAFDPDIIFPFLNHTFKTPTRINRKKSA